MKNVILTLLFLLPFAIHAQDTIVKRDGTKVPGKVTEVWSDVIKYNLPGTDGPAHVLRSNEVSRIIYVNGKTEEVNPSTGNVNGSFGSMLHKHMIGLNTIDLTFGLMSLSYEMNLAGGKFAFRIPVSSGVLSWTKSTYYQNNDLLYYNRFKYFSGGFDFLYFPCGQTNTISYYTGVSSEVGYTKQGAYYYYDFAPNPPYYVNTWYGAAGLINGILINVNERVNVSAYMTLGMKYRTSGFYYSNTMGMCRAGLTMGIRLGKPTIKS